MLIKRACQNRKNYFSGWIYFLGGMKRGSREPFIDPAVFSGPLSHPRFGGSAPGYKWVFITDTNKMKKWKQYLRQSHDLVKDKLSAKLKKKPGL